MTDIDAAISLLVTAKAKSIAEGTVNKIRNSVSTAVTIWRNQIRYDLSRPWPGGRNNTDTPYMRSGDLRKAVPRFRVDSRTTFNGSKLDAGQTVIRLKRVGGVTTIGSFGSSINAWDTYGRDLNAWHTQLAGWQDRAYNVLHEKIDKNLGFTKSYMTF